MLHRPKIVSAWRRLRPTVRRRTDPASGHLKSLVLGTTTFGSRMMMMGDAGSALAQPRLTANNNQVFSAALGTSSFCPVIIGDTPGANSPDIAGRQWIVPADAGLNLKGLVSSNQASSTDEVVVDGGKNHMPEIGSKTDGCRPAISKLDQQFSSRGGSRSKNCDSNFLP